MKAWGASILRLPAVQLPAVQRGRRAGQQILLTGRFVQKGLAPSASWRWLFFGGGKRLLGTVRAADPNAKIDTKKKKCWKPTGSGMTQRGLRLLLTTENVGEQTSIQDIDYFACSAHRSPRSGPKSCALGTGDSCCDHPRGAPTCWAQQRKEEIQVVYLAWEVPTSTTDFATVYHSLIFIF